MGVLFKLFLPIILLVVIYFSFTHSLYANANCYTPPSGATPVPRAVNGLISTSDLGSSVFYNNFNNCINDQQAALPTFEIPSFVELKSIFYDQYHAYVGTVKNPPLAGNADQNNLNSWLSTFSTNYVTGDVTIPPGGTLNQSNNGVAVVFVGGNLNIENDIFYYPNDSSGGLVFVVSGEVNIYKNVNEIDAVIIDAGNTAQHQWGICTFYDLNDKSGFPCPQTQSVPDITNPLKVNGSLISLSANKPIFFRRKLFDNNQPAELVNQQPKYLVLLKNLFSQTLTITTEGTDYASGVSISATPTPAPTATPTSKPTASPSPTAVPLNSPDCSVSPDAPPSGPGGTTSTFFQWSASASGGKTPYSYSWTGPGGLTGKTGQSPTIQYSTTGDYNGSVSISDSSSPVQTVSTNCSNVAHVAPPPPPPASLSGPTGGSHYATGSVITLNYSGISNPTDTDFIGLYKSNATGPSGYASRIYTSSCTSTPNTSATPPQSGSCNFTIPSGGCGLFSCNFQLFGTNGSQATSVTFFNP